MLRRLVDASYLQAAGEVASVERVESWLRELRTSSLLAECAERFADVAERVAVARSATAAALRREPQAIELALAEEETRERNADREYWAPLRAELEELRRRARAANPGNETARHLTHPAFV